MFKKKQTILTIIAAVVILITALILFTLSFRLACPSKLVERSGERSGREKSVERSVAIPQTTNQYQKLITPNLNIPLIYSGLNKVEDDDRYTQKIQAMIVPHHDLAYDITANAFYNLARLPEDPHPRDNKAPTLILIGPNHSDIGDCKAISSLSNWQTDFGILETDKEAIEKLKSDGQVCLDEKTFETEHSLAVLTPAIKKFFPNSKVIPIILNSKLNSTEINNLAINLADLNPDQNSILVASIDFSHYLTQAEANAKDVITHAAIKNWDYSFFNKFNSDYLDSPTSMSVLMRYAENVNARHSRVINHANSADYTHDSLLTTSYFSMIFSQN